MFFEQVQDLALKVRRVAASSHYCLLVTGTRIQVPDSTRVGTRLSNSALRSRSGRVRTPRHLLLCRWEGDCLAVARMLHERQDPSLHFDPDNDWE